MLALLAAAVPSLAPGDVPPLATELVTGGLQQPTSLTAPVGDTSRIFVTEQDSGNVRLLVDGVLRTEPYLTLGEPISFGGERGFLGLAFHPQFDANGRLYVFFNDAAGDTTLRELVVEDPTDDVATVTAQRELFTLAQPFPQHNGGQLVFGPDGYLYVSTGDGGSGGDPFNNAQDLSSLLGKILRIDVDAPAPYGIPADNPFVGVPGVAEEIYAFGLRNPWRFSIDARTGDLWIGDVGQQDREEIDLIPAGSGGAQNFGWRCIEGTLCTGAGCACPDPGWTDPVLEYDHSDGCAVVGGYVYRGSAIPELQGTYFFADYCLSRIWSFVWDGGAVTEFEDRTQALSPQTGGPKLISAMGQDGAGELYFCALWAGEIWKLVPEADQTDCDGDGTADVAELAAGSAFDVNANGIPDDCELLLTVGDVFKGQDVAIDAIGGFPGQILFLFGTFRGVGQGPCFFDGALCLDLAPIAVQGVLTVPVLGTYLADGQGALSTSYFIPAGLNPIVMNIQFQVVYFDDLNSTKSNPVQKQVLTGP